MRYVIGLTALGGGGFLVYQFFSSIAGTGAMIGVALVGLLVLAQFDPR
jgi:hypothetical protein